MNILSGTVIFLFTEIEGSTKLTQEYPDEMPVFRAKDAPHPDLLKRYERIYSLNSGFILV
jgi:hypothetical protein